MEITKNVEEIILKANLATKLDIIITDNKKVIYFVGDTNKCEKYLFSQVSKDIEELSKVNTNEEKVLEEGNTIKIIDDDDEKYFNQAIYKFYENDKFDKLIIFSKSKEKFSDKDLFIIKSTICLLEKFFNR